MTVRSDNRAAARFESELIRCVSELLNKKPNTENRKPKIENRKPNSLWCYFSYWLWAENFKFSGNEIGARLNFAAAVNNIRYGKTKTLELVISYYYSYNV